MTTHTEKLISKICDELFYNNYPLAFASTSSEESEGWQTITASNVFSKVGNKFNPNYSATSATTITVESVEEKMLNAIPREFKKALMYGLKPLNVKSMYQLVGDIEGQMQYYIDIDGDNTYLNITDNEQYIEVDFQVVYKLIKHTEETLNHLRAIFN